MEVTSSLLKNGLTMARQRTDVLVKNLTNTNSEEYCYQDGLISAGYITNGSTLQKMTIVQRVDENLVERIRDHHSRMGSLTETGKYYAKIERFFGDVGSKTSFAHTGSEMTQAVKGLMTNTDANRSKTIDAISRHIGSVSDAYTLIDGVRGEIMADINVTVNELNQFLANVAHYNGLQTQADDGSGDFSMINARRLDLHKAAEKLGLKVFSEGTSVQVMTNDEQYTLVSKNQAATFSVGMINDNVQLTYKGFGASIDVTNYYSQPNSTGSLSALIRVRDTYMTGIQQGLDNYSESLRDNFNAIHNLGTSLATRSVIIGSYGIPGYSATGIAADAFNAYANIDMTCSGTLRLASIDKDGKIQGSSDIDISSVTSLQDLIALINTQTATTNITADVTVNGEFKLSSTSGNVAMTSVDDSTPPTITGGGKTLGFSHYFGLNNLLSAGALVPGTSNAGLSSRMSVRQDIKLDPTLLASGKLSTSNPLPGAGIAALNPGDKNILDNICKCYSETKMLFAATNNAGAKNLTLYDFTSDLIKEHVDAHKLNSKNLESDTFIYEGLSKEAARISKGDENEASLALMQNSQWYQSLAAALKIIARMEDEVYKIL